MVCIKCGFENIGGTLFCVECGYGFGVAGSRDKSDADESHPDTNGHGNPNRKELCPASLSDSSPLEQPGERIRTILDSLEYGIIAVDRSLNVLEANRPVEYFLGIPPERLVDEPLPDVISEYQSVCCVQLRKAMTEKRPIRDHRTALGYGIGDTRDVVISALPLPVDGGSCNGAVLVLREAGFDRDKRPEDVWENGFHRMVGTSPQMREMFSLLSILAETESTVLITGESGTGKELVADAIHETGSRSLNPFVKVNCAALPEALLESELFGHVKGAFTGAVKDVTGRFQMAEGGTIFLDEIGDLPSAVQIKLLRVLQQKEIERVGDATPIPVDVRIVAATNQSLTEKIRRGLFREDLYYRLKVVEVPVPPLRSRKEDIPALINHFFGIFCERFRKDVRGLSEDVRDIFMEYRWPGNVRELEHALEHACVICSGTTILKKDLPRAIVEPEDKHEKQGHDPVSPGARALRVALQQNGWNKARTARELGIDRKTLYRRMKKFNIIDPFKKNQ